MRSPYIVYFDESGDHGMDSPDPDFPVFVLCGAVFKIENYLAKDCPAFSDIKFRRWFHDAVVFHSRKIRKKIGHFAALQKAENMAAFIADVNSFFANSTTVLIAAAIDKEKHKAQYCNPIDPYDLSLQFCLERLWGHVKSAGSDKLTFCIFEARGAPEDALLLNRFDYICSGHNQWGCKLPFRAVFADKKANLPGLQIADLAAYPIARHIQYPEKANPAWDIVEKKLRSGPKGYLGWGLKVFPVKS